MSLEDAIKKVAEPPRRKRRKHRVGRPNKLPAEMKLPPGTQWGQAMASLRSDRHRAFVLAYATMPWRKHGLAVAAAKASGFGSTKSSPASWASIAHVLVHDPAIQRAMEEIGRKGVVAVGLRGLRRLNQIVEDETHRDNWKAVNTAINAAYAAPSLHYHEHAHVDVSGTDVLARCKELARKLNVDFDAILHAPNARAAVHSAVSSMKLIEGVATEAPPSPIADRAVSDFIREERDGHPAK